MTFTERLREENDATYQAIFDHPYVQGLKTGHVPKNALVHYVKQDFEYLNAFMRVYGLAISKCETREEMSLFNEQIGFVLHSEIHPHNNLCEVAGVPYEELQGYPLAPGASHYISHMMTTAQQGTLGEIVAVLLPCPWTYLDIGERLMKEAAPQPGLHPFYEWINFYGTKSMEGVTGKLRSWLDRYAETASEREKEKMRVAFAKSCQLELGFWEMAYTVEEWPVRDAVLRR
ncbi:thiaminase II [Aureibacillus halotolerans]|uniref:Aminopyrimidine aminohydrolase n=1 Tax=Aureibacillus halotolerans TaxID=1508390 RepID=A0A4R6TWP1_9BACI|nr:thiaminase II [Aureibacillus halotolerans]TDQ38280.1 thiaminase/transcriptional activator TenA [Aureibacillus halotolerans]